MQTLPWCPTRFSSGSSYVLPLYLLSQFAHILIWVYMPLLDWWYSTHTCLSSLRHSFICNDRSMSGRHLIINGSSSAETIVNSCKTELLYIPGNAYPCQDRVISLENSQNLPSVTACKLGVVLHKQLSFSPHIDWLTWSFRFHFCNSRSIQPCVQTQRPLRTSVPCHFKTGLLQLNPVRSAPAHN